MDWHRLFGLILSDLFTGSEYDVELEKDLSVRRQLLDVVIIRRGGGAFDGRLPDGLEDMPEHNLLSYKSMREPLDDWTLKELTGHYVNYRKQMTPPRDPLLPESRFRLYGVSTRFPRKLAREAGPEIWRPIQSGVYELTRVTDRIRVIVLSELPQEPHNAPWLLFSGVAELVRYGTEHYRMRMDETSSMLAKLYENYQTEGLNMPYTIDDFRREIVRENIELLSPEERMKGLPAEERLEGLSASELEAHLKRLRSRENDSEAEFTEEPQ